MQIESIARSRSLAATLSRRAQMILRLADGVTNSAVARRYRLSRTTASLRRMRCAEYCISGLHNELKPRRPRSTGEDAIATLIDTVLTRKPSGKTHWSRRSLADETRLSKSTAHRYLTLFGLQPLGYVEGITHDYVRHGATMFFAALDVADGTVLNQCKPKHRHQEFLAFLRHIEAKVPEHLDVNLICDNNGTHKHARPKTWLARRPRFHLHFTPTYSSGLNQIERWFALITTQAIRRGSFDSVADFKRKIGGFVTHRSII